MQYTPTYGPWHTIEGTDGVYRAWNGKEHKILTSARLPWHEDSNCESRERYGNLVLAAAAPDLYRELKHLVRLLEPIERDGGLDVPGLATFNGARAALAKARGETV